MSALMSGFGPVRSPKKPRSNRQKSSFGRDSCCDDGFECKHCHAYVSGASSLSGVQNRNHCPYCLWSRHLDLHTPGDRLSACKSTMKPIGLTIKATNKKYGLGRGELMLIHVCTDCGRLSINRIAADDVPENILHIFETALRLDLAMQARLNVEGIRVLQGMDREMVRSQLFGASLALGTNGNL